MNRLRTLHSLFGLRTTTAYNDSAEKLDRSGALWDSSDVGKPLYRSQAGAKAKTHSFLPTTTHSEFAKVYLAQAVVRRLGRHLGAIRFCSLKTARDLAGALDIVSTWTCSTPRSSGLAETAAWFKQTLSFASLLVLAGAYGSRYDQRSTIHSTKRQLKPFLGISKHSNGGNMDPDELLIFIVVPNTEQITQNDKNKSKKAT
ncbi:hypothetical protein K440DRAFT_179328 [Wilcoxina mikolae CBS 423.85]|nr:hypothetical protein K440DRAFT_179328 [Wilcoxina mikolae CBS 423.85]